MRIETLSRAVRMAAGLALLAASAAWAGNECTALPPSALREHPCNPQLECLSAIPRDLKEPEAEARRKECRRLPTTGLCHGPDTYNPQAECRQEQRKR